MRSFSLVAAAAVSLAVLLLLLLPASSSEEALEQGKEGGAWGGEDDLVIRMATLGGKADVEASENSAEVEELARFAVDEHNKKENALLEFSRVLKAQRQVVSGIMHHLTVEVVEGGRNKLYEAKVWVQDWLNSKKLHEFNPIGESSSITPADLGVKRGTHEPGWRDIPEHDPVVKDAADHAVNAIQQRSNSLFPYELLDILHAKAEVVEEIAKFNMLLRLKRGAKEEKFKVEVHKNVEGAFHLSQMEPESAQQGD